MAVDTKRNEFIDVLKGIGILSVYLGHSAYWGTLTSRMIFSFHMPLFLLISGFFFRPEKFQDWKDLLCNVWNRLLLPYIVFCYIGLVLRLDYMANVWQKNPVGEIIRIVHGTGSHAIWFLMCLLVIQVIGYGVWRVSRRVMTVRLRMVLLFVAIVGLVVVAHYIGLKRVVSVVETIPFMLASVPCCLLFFTVGSALRNIRRWKVKFNVGYWAVVLALSMGLWIYIVKLIPKTFDLRSATFNAIHLIPCVAGLITAFSLAKIILACPILNKVFKWIGEHSLYMFVLELPIAHIIARFMGIPILYEMYYVKHQSVSIEVIRVVVLLGVVSALVTPCMRLIEKLQYHGAGSKGRCSDAAV